MHVVRSEDNIWSWVSSPWPAGIEVRLSDSSAAAFALWAILPASFWKGGYFLLSTSVRSTWVQWLLVTEIMVSEMGGLSREEFYYGWWFQHIIVCVWGGAFCRGGPGSRETEIRMFTSPFMLSGPQTMDDTTWVRLFFTVSSRNRHKDAPRGLTLILGDSESSQVDWRLAIRSYYACWRIMAEGSVCCVL